MSNVTSRTVRVLLSFVIAVLATVGVAVTASASSAEAPGITTTTAAAPAPEDVRAACGDTSGFRRVALSGLPREATTTYRLIRQGGPFPYPQDGTVFQNRERLLPLCPSGYYREYTVKTPGSPDRGARRIVTGSRGEYFYTADHYRSFVLVNVNG